MSRFSAHESSIYLMNKSSLGSVTELENYGLNSKDDETLFIIPILLSCVLYFTMICLFCLAVIKQQRRNCITPELICRIKEVGGIQRSLLGNYLNDEERIEGCFSSPVVTNVQDMVDKENANIPKTRRDCRMKIGTHRKSAPVGITDYCKNAGANSAWSAGTLVGSGLPAEIAEQVIEIERGIFAPNPPKVDQPNEKMNENKIVGKNFADKKDNGEPRPDKEINLPADKNARSILPAGALLKVGDADAAGESFAERAPVKFRSPQSVGSGSTSTSF